MSVLQVEQPSYMTEDLTIFEGEARKFMERECVPHVEQRIKHDHIDRETWNKAGRAGLLLASTPDDYGGSGGTFAHEAVLIDLLGKNEITRASCRGKEET